MVTEKLSDDAENNTVVASAGSENETTDGLTITHVPWQSSEVVRLEAL